MNITLLHARRGTTALAALALVAGGAVAAMPAASAVAGQLTAAAKPAIAPGEDRPAGDLAYEFTNQYAAGSSVTFTVGSNDCSTSAQLDKAVGFSTAPAVSVARTAGTGAVPVVTGTLGSSSPVCNASGIQDVFTARLPEAASDALPLKITVSGVQYDVGSDAANGDVTVHATSSGLTPAPSPASVANATVSDKSFSFDGFNTAQFPANGVALGTATIKGTRTSSFQTGDTVKLTVNDAVFTQGTPQITASPNYSFEYTWTGNTFTLTLTKSPVAGPLTLTVKGLAVSVTDAPVQVRLSASMVSPAVDLGTIRALNVLDANERFAGDDRYATASKLFDETVDATPSEDDPDDVAAAVVASGETFPEALGGGYLAKKKGTGLLLTKATSLPAATQSALTKHKVNTVYLLGGPAAVSVGVEDAIKALGITVVRLAGDDRYATNRAINAEAGGTADTVLVATGTDFPDALALGPISYSQSWPLVLSNGKELTDADKAQITTFAPDRAVIAGGTTAVSAPVETALGATVASVRRVAGDNRYTTATAIAGWATQGLATDSGPLPALGFHGDAAVATGTAFADALAAGTVLGQRTNALLLVGDAGSKAAAAYLGGKVIGAGAAQLSSITAIGGPAAVSGTQMYDLALSVQK